jgi:hypothetical protein
MKNIKFQLLMTSERVEFVESFTHQSQNMLMTVDDRERRERDSGNQSRRVV